MTSTETAEANEFFAQRTQEEVGGSTEDNTHDVHRSSFQAKQSTGQAPKKARGDCRVVIQYHMGTPIDDLKAFEKEHGRQYTDGVDFGRALLRWLLAEGHFPDLAILEEASKKITVTVEK